MNEGTANLFLVLVFVLCLAIIAYGALAGDPLPYMFVAVFLLMLAFYLALTLRLVATIVLEKMGLKILYPRKPGLFNCMYGCKQLGPPVPLLFDREGAGR